MIWSSGRSVRQQGWSCPSSRRILLLRGNSIECRINAEDPSHGFAPSCGKISLLHIPGGPWVRFDTALYQDYVVPPYYDSLLGKLIVCATDAGGSDPQDAGRSLRACHRGCESHGGSAISICWRIPSSATVPIPRILWRKEGRAMLKKTNFKQKRNQLEGYNPAVGGTVSATCRIRSLSSARTAHISRLALSWMKTRWFAPNAAIICACPPERGFSDLCDGGTFQEWDAGMFQQRPAFLPGLPG